jgi:hypothetical protein
MRPLGSVFEKEYHINPSVLRMFKQKLLDLLALLELFCVRDLIS